MSDWGEPAPKPDNFDDMIAAYKDPARWAVEVAKYNRQLDLISYTGRRP